MKKTGSEKMVVSKHLKLVNPYIVGYDVGYYYRVCHDHDFYEILFVLGGEAIHCVNDGVQVLKAGDVVFLRPKDEHFVSPYGNSSEKFEFFNLHISEDYMKTQFSYSQELQNIIDVPKLPLIINLKANDVVYMAQKLKKLNAMNFGEERTYLYYSILKDLLWHAIAYDKLGGEEHLPEWLETYIMYISKPDVFVKDYAEISERANVSNSYLWKVFKKYFGMTLTEYINSLRLEYAYENILSGKYSLSYVATMSGFNSYSYFYRKFVEKYGVSPKKISRRNNYTK